MYKLFLVSLAVCLSLQAQAQQDNDLKLGAELDSLISVRFPPVAPGCVVLVARKGKIIYEKAFGSANLELNVPMRTDMIFRLGSITKQYTAIAILQLVEQGKISLQDTLQKFIKDFPYKGPITIENLLTHTSGIMDYEALDTFNYMPDWWRRDFKPSELIGLFKNEPIRFAPGTQFAYSNSNYFLLGDIIEIISGQTYADYMAGHIFGPAGLQHTGWAGYTPIVPNRVTGYARYNGKFENLADDLSMTIPYAAGALMSNVEDMLKWHNALYAYRLVSKQTLDEATTSYRLRDGSLSGYGFGWFVKTRNGSPSIEHSGGIDGFQSDEIYFPEKDIFIATLYNSLNEGGSDVSFMALDNDIATLSVGQDLQKAIQVDTSILKQYVGVYESDPGHPGTITLENGQLQMEADAGGLPKSPLFAKSENVFFLKVIPADIEFVRDKANQVTGLIIHFNGSNQVAKKIK